MNNEISNLLIEYRKKKKISQRELAKRLGVDNAYITRIEKGIIKKLSINLLSKISKELELNFFDLLFMAKYTNSEIEALGIFNNINEAFNFVDNQLINEYSIKDENDNIRISIIKILDGYKNEKLSKKEIIGLLSCLVEKNLYDYLTDEEANKIKDIEQFRSLK